VDGEISEYSGCSSKTLNIRLWKAVVSWLVAVKSDRQKSDRRTRWEKQIPAAEAAGTWT
jgi:hypothetical protein